MNRYVLRERLKSGALRSLYHYARLTKRRLRGEPLGGQIPHRIVHYSPAALRAMIAADPAHPRLYYSLGLAYLEAEEAGSVVKALACFRSAATLNFESPVRIALYQGRALALLGWHMEAEACLRPLSSDGLTDVENELRAETLSQSATYPLVSLPSDWQLVADHLTCLPPAPDPPVTGLESLFSILVMGDPQADSALLCLSSRYLLAAPEVTGLTPQAATTLGLPFEVGIGPEETASFVASCCRRFLLR